MLYERFGGSFLTPALPEPLLLIMETAYACLLILFFLLLVKDAAAAAALVQPSPGHCQGGFPSRRARAARGWRSTALILALLGAWQAAKTPLVHTLEIILPRLPASLDGLSLAQLSDLHLGTLRKKDWLRDVVDRTNALHPDIILLTGDMIDGRAAHLAQELTPLADLRAGAAFSA